jgi:predicted RNase H-like HicB family nuclease
MDPTSQAIEFRFFEEASPAEHRVPAKVLADTLAHAQRVVHLLAISAAGREIRQRARVPAEMARQFVLECDVALPGSYVQPVRLRTGGDLFDDVFGVDVLHRFHAVGEALSDANWRAVRELVPDRAVRTRVLDEFVAMLPDPEAGWVVDLRNGTGRIARFDSRRVRAMREYQRSSRSPSEALASPVTVTGELVRIDFAEHKLTIRHHPTQRRLECEYGPDVEDMLVENRRGLIRVTGLVELDEQDRPIRLTDVFDIHELDLSPMVIESIMGTRRYLRVRAEPLTFQVDLDEDGQYLAVSDPELDIHVFGQTRADVLSELLAQLEMMWLEYAEAEEIHLTAGAASLGRSLRQRLSVQNDDA